VHNVAKAPTANQNILAVLASVEDRSSLKSILGHLQLDLRFAHTLEEAKAALDSSSIDLLISESSFEDGCSWRDFLPELHRVENAPLLVVADSLADEVLWVEVLNLGAYDLLVKPFEARDVLHVVETARLCRADDRLRKPLQRGGIHDIQARAAHGGGTGLTPR